MPLNYYILDTDHKPVRAEDKAQWFNWCTTGENFRVARTKIGTIFVSTIFKGIDLNADMYGGTPQLFETMIFGGPHHGKFVCTASWEAASEAHQSFVEHFLLDLTDPRPYWISELHFFFHGTPRAVRMPPRNRTSILPSHGNLN